MFSQTNELDEFYPTHLGNSWQYYSTDFELRNGKITNIIYEQDSVVKYIFYNDNSEPSIKINYDSSTVYYPNPELGWMPLYIFNVPLFTKWLRDSTWIEWIVYHDTFTVTLFGSEHSVKEYYYFQYYPDSNISNPQMAERLAQGIGPYEYEWEGGKETLVGCIINGIKYGTLDNIDNNKNIFLNNILSGLIAYPNPFNNQTTISFTISKSSVISMLLYNTSGQKVQHLLNEMKTAGSHTIKWVPNNLSSGIYFLVIKTKNHFLTKKLVVLK